MTQINVLKSASTHSVEPHLPVKVSFTLQTDYTFAHLSLDPRAQGGAVGSSSCAYNIYTEDDCPCAAGAGDFISINIYLDKNKHFAKRATAEVMFGQGLF